MGRAGGRGGGRSSGGSGRVGGGSSMSRGNRSSGSFGRSSSGFGSSRSYSSGGRTGSSGGSFWGHRTTGPIIINNSGNRNTRGYGGYNNHNRPVYNSSGNNNSDRQQNNSGCIHIALILVMVMSIIVLLFNTVLIVSSAKEQRVPLAAGAVIETEFYTDELNWISDESDLLSGMKYFYEKTGVQPYLYITDDVGGEFYEKREDFTHDKYDELFEDEGHVLVVFWEQDYYGVYCVSGSSASTVIDIDAIDIIVNKLDEYYWDSDLDEDAYFSKAFSEAADEIMAEPPSAFVSVLIPLIIFVAALAAEIIIRRKTKAAQREKKLKEMLDKPLETFGSSQAQELAKKYESSVDSEIAAKSEDKEIKIETSDSGTVNAAAEKENAANTNSSSETETDNNYINICTNCGKCEDADHNYCSRCGTRIR